MCSLRDALLILSLFSRVEIVLYLFINVPLLSIAIKLFGVESNFGGKHQLRLKTQ